VKDVKQEKPVPPYPTTPNQVLHNPVALVRWVPIEQVQANDYNPNSVATNEMRLLYLSILQDGYTQPVVTIWDGTIEKYVIIDGFHRYTTMRINPDLLAKNGGLLPIVVLNKTINERMASTVRHNRARGKHSIKGMSNMVFQMLTNGMTDADICNQLGMEPEELIRLKHITGFSKLFADAKYSRGFETETQIKIRKEYERNQGTNDQGPTTESDQAVLE
jgi:hypothetical protein